MRGHVLTLSLQMYGCRVVQKALEHLPIDYQSLLVSELKGHILNCIKDQNGNHVIQKAIERVAPNHIRFIIDAFSSHVFELATHPYGCRVMQRVFEHCDKKETNPLLEELLEFSTKLVQDQYGNYVVQYLLEKGRPEEKRIIVGRLKGQMLTMSKHKFASNVVEKCVTYACDIDRKSLVEEVVNVRADGVTPLVVMMKDQYANYVIQKMLDVANKEQRDLLVSRIRPHLTSLRKFTVKFILFTNTYCFSMENI